MMKKVCSDPEKQFTSTKIASSDKTAITKSAAADSVLTLNSLPNSPHLLTSSDAVLPYFCSMTPPEEVFRNRINDLKAQRTHSEVILTATSAKKKTFHICDIMNDVPGFCGHSNDCRDNEVNVIDDSS